MMVNRQSITYKGSFGNVDVIATSWSNDYHRDWFKVDKANNGKAFGISNGINNVIDAANNGNADAQGILDGTRAVEVKLKHNNRFYGNEGIQFQLSTDIGNHSVTFGYRDMEDYESRFKTMSALIKVLMGRILLFLHAALDGQEAITDSEKLTLLHILCKIPSLMDKLTLTLGYRSEDYDKVENRWSDAEANKNYQRF